MAAKNVAVTRPVVWLRATEPQPLAALIKKLGPTAGPLPALGRLPETGIEDAVAQLRRIAQLMRAAIGDAGYPFTMSRPLMLADLGTFRPRGRSDDALGRFGRHSPAVARWLELIRAHPVYAPTYYFGSLLTEKYPHLAELRQNRPHAADRPATSGTGTAAAG